MSFVAGQSVIWVHHGRHIPTRVRSLETITRADGSLLACAAIELNRFVPLSELRSEADAKSLAKESSSHHRKTHQRDRDTEHAGVAESAPRRVPIRGAGSSSVPDLAERDSPSAWTDSGSSPKTKDSGKKSAKSVPVAGQSQKPAPVDVLAFDFMNLLVRAWHAGKPTEIHAVRSMFQTMANAVRELRPRRIVFALDGGHVYRSRLLPQYKAHRPEHPPELRAQIELAQKALQLAGIPAVRVLEWEADDVLASIVERFPCVVIASSDKDLLSLHGRCRIYHPWSGGGFVDPEEKLGIPAGQVQDYLAMCGDSSDGIPGVKGCGPKTAAALLTQFDSLESILVAAQSGKIPGAIGKKLIEQRADALNCQQVVQLRNSLPIPELQPWQPPFDYQSALQSIGLGSVAAILDSIVPLFIQAGKPQPEEAKSNLSAAPVEAEQIGRNGGFADHESSTPVQPLRATQQEHRYAETVVPGDRGGDVSQNRETAPVSSGIISRSVDDLLARLGDRPDWTTPESAMIACWIGGYRCRGTERENPWRLGTNNHTAWAQGYFAEPLLIGLDRIARPVASEAVETASGRRPAAGSLF